MDGGAKKGKQVKRVGNDTKHTDKQKGVVTWKDVLEKAKKTIREINEKRKAIEPPKPLIPEEEVAEPTAITRPPKESPNDIDERMFGPFVADIPNISEEERKEAIIVLKRLAFFDSIHDFWPKRGAAASSNKKAITDADEDAPLDLDPARMNTVHQNLLDSIKTYVEKQQILSVSGKKGGAPSKKSSAAPGEAPAKKVVEKTPEEKRLEEEDRKIAAQAAAILREVTGSVVGSVHGIEDKVLEYLKRNFAPFNEPEYVIKVTDVLDKWRFKENFKSNWDAYSTAIKNLPNTVLILIDGTYIKSLDNNQLGTLGFFILACMDPTKQPGKGSPEYFTFDMGPRDIGKIFARFEQVNNAIYPQNVADSATTSFTALEGRSVFFRANDQEAEKTKGVVEHTILANSFTHDRYILKFVDTGFSNKNRFGFSIEIFDKANPKKTIGSIKFGKGNEQGPSVNYLMDAISKGTLKGVTPSAPKVATIKQANDQVDKDLLFDIKRIGDQEQMRVSNARGITGDHFASVFRRTLRKPGIFHSSKGFRVWRAPLKKLSFAETKAQAIAFRKSKIIEKLKIIAGLRGIGERVQTVRDDLLKMYDEVNFGIENGYVFKKPIAITTPLTKEYNSENYTDIAATIATYILRLRMRDMLEQVSLLIMRVESLDVSLEGIDEAACLIDQPRQSNPTEACPDQPAPPSDDVIEAALDKLESYVEQMDILKSLNISFFVEKEDDGTITEKTPDIYTPLFEPSGQLLRGATNTLFNFSANPFLHPETGIASVIGRLLDISNIEGTRISRVSNKINSLLVSYFQARDTIKEAFYDPVYKSEVEDLTDIRSGLTPAQVVSITAADGTPENRGLAGVVNRVGSLERLAGGAEVQQGGAGEATVPPSPLQYRDLHDLLFALCREAELAIESDEDPIATLDDIEVTWVTEVDQLRNNSIDIYGAPYEENEPTKFISALLSLRKDNGTLFAPNDTDRRYLKEYDDLKKAVYAIPDVEKHVLNVLANLKLVILSKTDRYASPEGWKEIIRPVNTLAINPEPSKQVLGLLKGGGLEGEDETPSNAVAPSGSSRRSLYAGLRKRSGAGSAPEL